MASLAVFLYANRVGVARVKAPGAKPGYSPARWTPVEDAKKLLDEPILFASLLRELIGDENAYDLYISVWPEIYSTIMFSHGKNKGSNVARLRQSELETVFHGEQNNYYTTDLMLDKGRYSFGDRSRRLIFAVTKARVNMLCETLKAQKMKVKRIAPMDAAVAEAALAHWAPDPKTINAVIVLEEGCTSFSFLKNGTIQTMRTLPDGFGGVMEDYRAISGMGDDSCRQLIMTKGLNHTDEDFPFIELQDRVLVACNRIVADFVRTLHTVFGEDAVVSKVLLCGTFARTEGLAEHFAENMATECVIAGTDTLKAGSAAAIALESESLESLFPYATVTAAGADLMGEKKKTESDKQSSLVAAVLILLVAAGVMAVTPITMNGLKKERDAGAALLATPEYVAVQELLDRKDALQREKNNLENAIANLPHGATKSAEMITELVKLTEGFGTVASLSVDYNAKVINISLTTASYGLFVGWQEAIEANESFGFATPPSFNGNGVYYTVEASLSAAAVEEAEVEVEAESETEEKDEMEALIEEVSGK